MHWITRAATTAATCLALALPTIGVAQADTVSIPSQTTPALDGATASTAPRGEIKAAHIRYKFQKWDYCR